MSPDLKPTITAAISSISFLLRYFLITKTWRFELLGIPVDVQGVEFRCDPVFE